nr:PREDICTED: probable glucuronokinase 2 [Lepisosteus oculatus]
MKFYNITDGDLPRPVRANFILNVETEELFITAGLQDRVVQVYEGLVYMDFGKELMEGKGYGIQSSHWAVWLLSTQRCSQIKQACFSSVGYPDRSGSISFDFIFCHFHSRALCKHFPGTQC